MKKPSAIVTVLGALGILLLGQRALVAQAPSAGSGGATEAEIRKLVEELDCGRAAWINGQLESSGTAHMVQAPDMTIFGPFGGTPGPRDAGPKLRDIQRQVVAQFKGGTGKIELLKAMSSGDLLVLVLLETNQVKFDNYAEPRPWVLRTTQVFRRDGERWQRLHRHADPLTKLRSLDETLALYE